MIRRSALAILPVVAALTLSSCSTFNRNDAVATVDGQELSRHDLADLLSNNVVQNQLTGALIDGRASLGGQADQVIGIWISLTVVARSGLADLSGATEQADLTAQYKDDYTNAPPAVRELLTRFEAFHNQVGSLDAAKLHAAVEDADVHVDSRYGTWDPAAATVVPFGESA